MKLVQFVIPEKGRRLGSLEQDIIIDITSQNNKIKVGVWWTRTEDKLVGEGTAVYISPAVGFTAAVAFRNSY